MKKTEIKKIQRNRRHKKIRSKLSGTTERPRLSVFKSNKHISVQLIDDEKCVTLASSFSREVKGKSLLEKSKLVGKSIAEKALAKKIKEVVFDRGGFMYTGCVAALAEGAREGGLIF
ncbi:MAG: 50S ribosomal protein L18 [Candidatus Paceibacterota bacterium]